MKVIMIYLVIIVACLIGGISTQTIPQQITSLQTNSISGVQTLGNDVKSEVDTQASSASSAVNTNFGPILTTLNTIQTTITQTQGFQISNNLNVQSITNANITSTFSRISNTVSGYSQSISAQGAAIQLSSSIISLKLQALGYQLGVPGVNDPGVNSLAQFTSSPPSLAFRVTCNAPSNGYINNIFVSGAPTGTQVVCTRQNALWQSIQCTVNAGVHFVNFIGNVNFQIAVQNQGTTLIALQNGNYIFDFFGTKMQSGVSPFTSSTAPSNFQFTPFGTTFSCSIADLN